MGFPLPSVALFTPNEMRSIDAAAAQAGQSGTALMARAGRAVADCARTLKPGGPVAVLAGPGKNGGDGYAAAIELRDAGEEVRLFALPEGPSETDARHFAEEWNAPPEPFYSFDPSAFALVIDALFGAGLSRPLDGVFLDLVRRVNAADTRVLAVDVPSGVRGADGRVEGEAVMADATVTFVARKPGHLLLPGRDLCGVLTVADIGIDTEALGATPPEAFANEPALFAAHLLRPQAAQHKYDRGHVGVFSGGPTQTGAARMAGMAALRGGAGLVTVLSPPSATLVNASHLTAVMLKRCADTGELATLLKDERLGTFVLGPGFGDLARASAFALAILGRKRRLVLDADGITAFAEEPDALFAAARSEGPELVLTPHAGEFKRLFPDLADEPSKIEKARAAARRADATIILKGSDTVIASPDGRASIDANGTPALATAGSGDVLAGLVAAQLANGVPPFEAACAGVWVHGEAAKAFGIGLIAEDLPDLVPQALARLHAG
ncbi:NAD(P)H-hydrate dehydratase [Aureimonas mangrovi]|uniref:NAD(P)H-hydrate dehydratase n=1 Tax=Aureimonas mangrovi TaxID=2758041 RepID=UPI001FE4CBE8|nr:NAD(P)H-hydrate dehydratase [Aureimonas mangrovi]